MNLNRIRDLAIAKTKYSFLSDIKEGINYSKWVEYINNHSDYFIWLEDTEEGKETLANIDKVPDWAREGTLSSLNKNRCYAEFNNKKGYYNIVVTNYDQKIGISFEKKVTKQDLIRFLDMANYLDAYLLNNRTEIIDEKVIESLE